MFCNTETGAIEQLKRDKHTLLEGYVTEYLFSKQFLEQMGDSYSHGWWSGTLKGRRYFFVIKNNLTSLDIELLSKLKLKYDCWQVYYEGNEWFFCNNSERLHLNEFISKNGLVPRQAAVNATDDTTDVERQDKCITFFKRKNILIDIALERNFADDILSVYFNGILNIDFFTKNKKGQLWVIEVKYKTESYDGYFGINMGEVILFKELRQLGFKVYHAILYKNRKNKDMSIFDYISNENIPHEWYMKEFSDSELVAQGVAPTKTSVDGKKKQGFYKLKKDSIVQAKYKTDLDM